MPLDIEDKTKLYNSYICIFSKGKRTQFLKVMFILADGTLPNSLESKLKPWFSES